MIDPETMARTGESTAADHRARRLPVGRQHRVTLRGDSDLALAGAGESAGTATIVESPWLWWARSTAGRSAVSDVEPEPPTPYHGAGAGPATRLPSDSESASAGTRAADSPALGANAMTTARSGTTIAFDPALEITQLRRRAQFRDDDVATFLEHHPWLPRVLLEALEVIPRFFGDPNTVVLDVVEDADDSDHEELYALIQTTLPAAEALRRLKRFDEAWWLDALDRARGDLTISLEFA